MFGYFLISFLLTFSISFSAAATDFVPVSYQGRFRPIDAYSRLWLYELYHRQTFKSSHRPLIPAADAEDLIWQLLLRGHEPFDRAPLFWVHYAEIKQSLGLDVHSNYFTYNQLTEAFHNTPESKLPFQSPLLANQYDVLRAHLQFFESLKPSTFDLNKDLEEALEVMHRQKFSSTEIAMQLDNHYPLHQRLRQASPLMKVLPGKEGDWFSLQALKLKVFDPRTNGLMWAPNFTLLSPDLFSQIRTLYLELEKGVDTRQQLQAALLKGYASLAGKPYKEAIGKTLSYPSLAQLKAESLYYQYPFVLFAIAAYSIAIILFLLRLQRWALPALSIAFLLHTAVLFLRCYILGRPPVSNMFETVIYVPWIAVAIGFALQYFLRTPLLLLASSIVALALLIVLELSQVNSSLEQVQAVLDSQYWLIIHVLLVVGSYGVFALAGVLGHFYLGAYAIHRKETQAMEQTAKCILQALYIGVALLIPGTILGGVWAAESWGRFWDWDPKESWAFISACIYLIFIHAYTFQHIANFGLALGSIVGLLAISFTWYGVNYILGTGLHSYGFGSGGEQYYYFFLIAESLFIGTICMVRSPIKN